MENTIRVDIKGLKVSLVVMELSLNLQVKSFWTNMKLDASRVT